MESKRKQTPLIVIVGPTGSGKTALAIELAKKYHGEIICADSRTIYKGMDIGTAKPTPAEQLEVPHHLIDVILPDASFSAAEFKRQALLKIDDIALRGRLPMLVGGTGLYVDGVIFDFAFLPPVPPEDRAELEALSLEQLQQKIIERGITMPENSRNRRHLTRALETNGAVPVKKGLRENTLVLGMEVSKELVRDRITRRVDAMVASGFLDEVRELVMTYGAEAPGLQATGYKAFREYLEGKMSLEQAKEAFIRNDMQLARRQRTWFKRGSHIHWIKNAAEAESLIKSFLQQK